MKFDIKVKKDAQAIGNEMFAIEYKVGHKNVVSNYDGTSATFAAQFAARNAPQGTDMFTIYGQDLKVVGSGCAIG